MTWPNLRFKLPSTGPKVSADREPIMGVWGRAPSRFHGQSPWSGGKAPWSWKLFSFSTSNDSGKIYPIDRVWQTECLWCLYYIEQNSKYLPP